MEELLDIYNEACAVLRGEHIEAEVHENYSGRGMYGSTTHGITTGASGVMVGWAVTMACQDRDVEPTDFLPERSDNMGFQMIYYK